MNEGLRGLYLVSLVLVIIAALVWGVIGLVDYNVISEALKAFPMVSRIIYIVFGLAGLVVAFITVSENKY